MKSLSVVFIYALFSVLLLQPCSAAYEPDKRFVDDTEIYEYVNTQPVKKPKHSITLVLDNSASMEEYSFSHLYDNQTWDNSKAYQVENDDCHFCDHRNYITTTVEKYIKDKVPNLNQAGAKENAISKLYLRLPKFKNCTPQSCEMLDGENVLIDIAKDFLFPDLYYDGFVDLRKYTHLCSLFMKSKYNLDTQNNLPDVKKIVFPVTNKNECKIYQTQQPYTLNKSKKKRFVSEVLKQDNPHFSNQYYVESTETSPLCTTNHKNYFERSINSNLGGKNNIDNYFEEFFGYKEFLKSRSKIISKLNTQKEDLDRQKSAQHHDYINKYEQLKENQEYLEGYIKQYGYRDYDIAIKEYKKRIKKISGDLNKKNEELRKLSQLINQKESEINDEVNSIKPYFESVINIWNNTMSDYARWPEKTDSDQRQGCAMEYLKDKGINTISTFQHRNFIKGLHHKNKNLHLYLATRYEVMTTSLEFAFKNFLPDQTNINIVPFNVKMPQKNNIKESTDLINEHGSVSITYNGQESQITIDEKIRSMNAYKKLVFNKADPTSIQRIMGSIKYHGNEKGTPTTDALIIGFDTMKRNLQPNTCYESNKMILFTDGDANKISAKSRNAIKSIFKSEKYKESNDKCHSGDEDICNKLLAELIGKKVHTVPNGNMVRIPIYVIGFKGGLTYKGQEALHSLSKANRGENAILVDTLEDMQQAFSEAVSFAELSEDITVSPASPPTAGGGVSRGETAFFGLFKPDSKPLWEGNIKCYRVDLEAKESKYRYKDSNNNPAFCLEENKPKDCVQPGQINPNSVDYFNLNGAADGNQVFNGGIRLRSLTLNSTLSVQKKQQLMAYTDKSKTEQEQLRVFEPAQTQAKIPETLRARLQSSFKRAYSLLGKTAPNNALAEELLQRAVNWLAGFNEAGNALRSDIGDLLHTEITVLNYQDDSLLIAPSNDGFLRAYKVEKGFDPQKARKHDFGALIYSFIPQALFDSVWWRINSPLQQHKLNITKFYGFDGSLTPIHFDTNLNGVIDKKEKAFVIVGMRRGGNSYYLFDVSNPFSNRNRAEPQVASETEPEADSKPLANKPPQQPRPRFREGIQLVRRIGGVETYLNRPLTPESIKDLKKVPILTQQDEVDETEWQDEKEAYSVLAQTWSKPRIVKLALSTPWPRTVGNAEVNPPAGCDHAYCYAFIFGGGYNPNVRDMIVDSENQRTQAAGYTDDKNDYIGNAIYMINAATGKLLWWASSEEETKPKQTIKNLESVPGAITTLNVGGDNGNATDVGFFFDIEGGLFRINFHDFKADIDYTKGSLYPKWDRLKIPSKAAVVSLGKLGSEAQKRFTFYEPAVTFFTDPEGYDFFTIGFGTGYRPSPKGGHNTDAPKNMIGVLFDYPVYEPKTKDTTFTIGCHNPNSNCLLHVTKQDHKKPREKLEKLKRFRVKDTQSNRPIGWYTVLDQNKKEKIISAGKTVNGYLAIESFLPQASATETQTKQCVADLGERRIWVMDLKHGQGYFEQGKRYKKSGRSLPVERLGLIRHQGDYLITGTRLEVSGQDAVQVGSGLQAKQELGWREAVPESAIFSEQLTLPGATTPTPETPPTP